MRLKEISVLLLLRCLSRFYSTLVRLKAQRAALNYWIGGGFYSTLVRLKAYYRRIARIDIDMFLFHIGAIKSPLTQI